VKKCLERFSSKLRTLEDSRWLRAK